MEEDAGDSEKYRRLVVPVLRVYGDPNTRSLIFALGQPLTSPDDRQPLRPGQMVFFDDWAAATIWKVDEQMVQVKDETLTAMARDIRRDRFRPFVCPRRLIRVAQRRIRPGLIEWDPEIDELPGDDDSNLAASWLARC